MKQYRTETNREYIDKQIAALTSVIRHLDDLGRESGQSRARRDRLLDIRRTHEIYGSLDEERSVI